MPKDIFCPSEFIPFLPCSPASWSLEPVAICFCSASPAMSLATRIATNFHCHGRVLKKEHGGNPGKCPCGSFWSSASPAESFLARLHCGGAAERHRSASRRVWPLADRRL